MTKKILKGALLSVLLGLALFICVKTSNVQAADFSPAGSYTLVAISNGVDIADSARLKSKKFSGSLTINGDNTGTIVIQGQSAPIAYTGSAIVLSDGTAYPCIVTPIDITLAVDESTTYAFARNAAKAGKYKMTGMNANGQAIGAADLKKQLGVSSGSLLLNADGTGTLELSGTSMPLSYNSYAMTLKSGAVCAYTVNGNTITVAVDPNTTVLFSK